MAESHEAVALELLRIVANVENIRLTLDGPGEPADRAWVLRTYRRCLKAVQFEDSAAPAPAEPEVPRKIRKRTPA